MAKPIITIGTAGDFKIVEFEIPGGVTTSEEFASAFEEVVRDLPGDEPVLVSGRGPVWGYAMLVHGAHPTPAIGTFDPRLGFVIVATHDERFQLGDIVPDPRS